MSLIAEALKKAQAAKLGRRYLRPDPSGVLPREGRSAGRGVLDPLLGRLNLSPALWVGLGAGLFLFVVLFAYFFYGQSPKAKAPLAAKEQKAARLILTPPPPLPAVEPLVLNKEALAARGLKEPETQPEGSPEKIRGKRKAPGSAIAKVEKKAGEQAPEARRKKEAPKVAVTASLSEEVRYRFNLALFYQEERNFPQARREYEKVIQMWPLYAEARNNLGVVYKELGMYEQAVAEFKKALALNPQYPRAYHNLGVIYQLKGDWKQAVKSYEMALSLDRSHLSSYNNLGLVYRSQGQLHEAREVLEKALALNPSFPQTHYNLGLVLEEAREMEGARFHYQRFIDLSGDANGSVVEKVRDHLQRLAGKR